MEELCFFQAKGAAFVAISSIRCYNFYMRTDVEPKIPIDISAYIFVYISGRMPLQQLQDISSWHNLRMTNWRN